MNLPLLKPLADVERNRRIAEATIDMMSSFPGGSRLATKETRAIVAEFSRLRDIIKDGGIPDKERSLTPELAKGPTMPNFEPTPPTISGKLWMLSTIPGELWMLWDGSQWIPSGDDPDGGKTYLVASSGSEAELSADYQEDVLGVDCIPIRVK